MSPWGHKSAHEIAGAVAMHMKNSSAKSQRGFQLIDVYKDAKRAAATERTGPQELADIRSSLCCACRGDELYPCDVAEGWSQNCSFVQQCNA
jgi:hypothetical protein